MPTMNTQTWNDKIAKYCPKIEMIPLSQICTGEYQRAIRGYRIKRIVNNFDPAKLGVLVLNKRGDKIYAVIDGQNRLAALRILGAELVWCIVLEGLTIQEEADFFGKQNDNKTALCGYDKFVAGVYADDPLYVNLNYILTKYGYRASRESGPRCITAIDGLKKIPPIFGFPVLQQVIEWISMTWPNDTVVVKAEMLTGLAEFASRFGKRISTALFTSRMLGKQPGDLLYEFKQRTQGRGNGRNITNKTMRFTMCSVLVDAFNKGLSANSRLRLQLSWDRPDLQRNVEDVAE